MSQKEITRYLIYHFTTDERAAMSAELVRQTQELETLADRKKQVVADFTAKITAANAEIFKIARTLGNGYEYRDLPCVVVFDEPRKGMKRIVRKDTGEIVEECPMTADELQMVLELDVQAAAEEIKHDEPAGTPDSAPETAQEPEAALPCGPQQQVNPYQEADDDFEPIPEEFPSALAEPVKLTHQGENSNAMIVILETGAGFEAEASFQLRGDEELSAVDSIGIHPAESAAREAAATALWSAAQKRYAEGGRAQKKAAREVMEWAGQWMPRKAA